MDASEIYSRRLESKEVIFPKEGEFIFPIADGRIKTLGRDQELRTSTLIRHRPIQGESAAFDTIARRRLVEDQDTILELSGRVQEPQNEVNCMNDSKDFQDAESIRSGNSHVTSRPVSVPPHPMLQGMLRHSFVSPRRREGPPSIWDTWYIGKRFCKSTCIFISSLSSRIESMEFVNRGAAPFIYSGEK